MSTVSVKTYINQVCSITCPQNMSPYSHGVHRTMKEVVEHFILRCKYSAELSDNNKSFNGFSIYKSYYKLFNTIFDLDYYDTNKEFVIHSSCTILVFPPANYSVFEGGNLILYPDTGEILKLYPSKIKYWTSIIISGKLNYECDPIINGKMFVFSK
jgi:hypothetical protein